MKTPAIFLLICISLFLCGCKDNNIARINSELLDENEEFSLYVSNQSFAIKNVDISVEVDGELVISEYFNVGTQHTFKEFKLALKPDKHRIHAWSNKGEAETSSEFEVKEGDIGVLTYLYSRKSKHGDPLPKQITFSVGKGPLQIM